MFFCIHAKYTHFLHFLCNEPYFSSLIFSNHLDANCSRLSWRNKWIWINLSQIILTWGTFFSRKLIAFKQTWMQNFLELSTSATNVIISGYVIANLTGGRLNLISCPSNLYFSIWGMFFVSIWILSMLFETWRK